MSGCIDFRDQIKAAKIGAIIRCGGDFLDRIISSLDYIDNELRTTRNRFIHDIWAPAEDGTGAIKVDLTPKAKTAASSGERTIQLWDNAYLSIAEVQEVTADIINERDHLAKIVNCFQNPNDVELPSLLPAQPPRLHLLR